MNQESLLNLQVRRSFFSKRLGRAGDFHVFHFAACYGDLQNLLFLSDDGTFEAFFDDGSHESQDARAQGTWKTLQASLQTDGGCGRLRRGMPPASERHPYCRCGSLDCEEPFDMELELMYERFALKEPPDEECDVNPKATPGRWHPCAEANGWEAATTWRVRIVTRQSGLGRRIVDVEGMPTAAPAGKRMVPKFPTADGGMHRAHQWEYCTTHVAGN